MPVSILAISNGLNQDRTLSVPIAVLTDSTWIPLHPW